MNINFKQHELLGLLVSQYIEWDAKREKIVAVPYNVIYSKLKCTREELHLTSSILFRNEEIGLYNLSGIEGLHVKPKGIDAYSLKKYRKEFWANKRTILKDYLGITVSIIAITTAVIGVVSALISLSNNSNRIEKLEKRINAVEQRK